jgi:hypothetical protein
VARSFKCATEEERISYYSHEIWAKAYSQQYARMTIAPENKPPVPMPAIALPTINASLLGAVAQTRDLSQHQ